jgi:predicted metal-dependent enzyme (double-stranded beta helix superfamily)
MSNALAVARISPRALGRLVRHAAQTTGWAGRVIFDTDQHWFRRLELTGNYEIWLLSWLPGQHTGFHDHGGACGAFEVVRGELCETLAQPGSLRQRSRAAGTGAVTTFGAGHVHDVGNESGAPAISVHAYAPPLTAMRRYQMTPSGLSLVQTDMAEQDW